MSKTTRPHVQALPINHQLLWYTIERVLGRGAIGTTYLATDQSLNRLVAIKEYLPTLFAERHGPSSVVPINTEHRDSYQQGLDNFLQEAQILARFRHDNIVQIHTAFQANNTAYMVMEYQHGESLAEIYKSQRQKLNQTFFERCLYSTMRGLNTIHAEGFVHLDIKPANLYIRQDGSPSLIDLGSARTKTHQANVDRPLPVSTGYSPPEQYNADSGEHGTWTDIYALAATIYRGVTGIRPQDALDRNRELAAFRPDPLPALTSLSPPGYSTAFCNSIDQALAVNPRTRPQNITHWRQLFHPGGDGVKLVPTN